jgi:hypothetical protein
MAVLAVALLIATPGVAVADPQLPPPISEATAESDLMFYDPIGSPNALEGSTKSTATVGTSSYPVDGAQGPMPFNIGYVQRRPHVYAIFWGSEWNEKAGTREKVLDLYRTISGSPYGRILTQYFDHTGYIAGETDLTSYTDTRVAYPTHIEKNDIKTEINEAIQAHPEWGPVNYENQYVVFTPPNAPSKAGCGYHSWSGQYSWSHIYWSEPECLRGLEPWGALQVTASHEWAESATDPIPMEDYWGWAISNEGGEIADLCNSQSPSEHAEISPGIFAARLLDDYLWAANGTPCVAQDAAPERYTINTGGTSFRPHTATLTGTIDAAGWSANYQFALTGPTGTAYTPPRNQNAAVSYGFGSAGSGFGNTPVSAEFTNLKGSTAYTARLDSLGALTSPMVFEEYGSPKIFTGNEVQFTTPHWRPSISGVSVSDRTTAAAIVKGSINPEGTATHYRIEYGVAQPYSAFPAIWYTQSVPVPDENVGSGTVPVAVSQVIGGLKPATEYDFRLVATNDEGTSVGANISFTTLAVTPTFQSAFGGLGTGPGQFSHPTGVATDQSGNVWVVDSDNARVEKFNAKGEFLLQFGSKGTGNGQFLQPQSVAVCSSGNVFVTDKGSGRVGRFTSLGEFVEWIGTEVFQWGVTGTLPEPSGISCDSESAIRVASQNGRIYRYSELPDAGGHHFLGSFAEVGTPTGVASGIADDIWVSDASGRILQKRLQSGEVRAVVSQGEGDGQVREPLGIRVDPSGNLIIADSLNNRIQVVSPMGEYLGKFGTKGSGPGQMTGPADVAVGLGGVFYVADWGNNRIERWSQPAAPGAITRAASNVSGSGATLNGSIYPGSSATSYMFEYGTSSSYGTNIPVPSEDVGSGLESVAKSNAVTGLKPGTTYHFRLVASNKEGVRSGEDQSFKTDPAPTSAQLGGMIVTDPFNGTTTAASDFANGWSPLGWAGGSVPKGLDRTNGWGPSDAYSTVNGAFYGRTLSDVGPGLAAVATMVNNPGNVSRYFSLWLDMTTPSSARGGYELRFTNIAANSYNVTLSRWQAGSQTVMATQSAYAFANGNSVALLDQGGTVSAWTNTGAGFSQLLSGDDTTFAGGNAGVEGSGNITRLTNFKVGSLMSPAASMDTALTALMLNDSFGTSENPLSGSGAWSALSWSNSTSGHNTGRVAGGWGPYDPFPTINGAFWQRAAYVDTGAGIAVAATLTARPANTSRYFSLWLGMPMPATARSGYEVRFIEIAPEVYEVTLSRWQAGTRTVLASKSSYQLRTNSRVALVTKAGTVSVLAKAGAEFSQILSANDSTFNSGYSGVEASGNATRLKDFGSGPLPPF